ncbi:frequency clock protein-domain-containing protein [Phyllosticta paracitricarpa]|uniref:Frequency clock protein-domain-containing protein n=1 Tax=Phyllosticta paracitricarpa TaxID=2016321 RepID=A0ABR1ND51_9PEZI
MADQLQPQAPLVAAHPRRPPAHKSVSLLHSPPGKNRQIENVDVLSHSSSNVPSSDRANPPSPGSSKPLSKKESSGETSDAGKWFESSNNNVNQDGSYMDNDPPFFLRNSSSSTSPDMPNPLQMHVQGQASMPHRPPLMHMRTDGSSAGDFRSVIDDLTVENKKLKKKLKRYERVHDAHLQEEKLFEVRVHGLPPSKKRELEDMLKKFAMEMDENSSNEDTANARPSLHAQATTSSLNYLQNADSAYHSMSASGQNSNAASSAQGVQPKKRTRSQFDRQQDNIQSYLQDIPLGLMPKTISMTDTAKKKLVVRRLEQIFAGKGAGANGHQQPMQQQEVAQSAAQADRLAQEEETGQPARKEGLREARIMYDGKRERRNRVLHETDANRKPVEAAKPEPQSGSSPGRLSPDQRPTRPLDLDPQRAQVPADNLSYIRHLGFSPQDPELPPVDGHGWIYLNLLVNMAQLHTINVTTEFVIKALQQYSSQIELSHDGRKVRWRGGHHVSVNSSDASPDKEADLSNAPNVKKLGSKRFKIEPSSAHTSSEATGRSSDPSTQRNKHELSYTPLFYHKDTSSDDLMSNVEPASEFEQTPPQADVTGANVSSAFASSGMKTYSSKRKRDDGPIIFYNRAKFCTDLSGDRVSVGRPQTSYTPMITTPIGGTPERPKKLGYGTDDDRRGPLARAALQDMIDDDSFYSSDAKVDIDCGSLSSGNSSPISIEPMALEVSGVGGIIPEDNLFIEVNRRQIRQGSRSLNNGACHALRPDMLYPSKISMALSPTGDRESTMPPPVKKRRLPLYAGQIVGVRESHLPPSDLPPPSLLPFDSSCDADDDSDLDDTELSDIAMENPEGSSDPTAAPCLMNMATKSDDASDSLSQATENGHNSQRESPDNENHPRLASTSRYRLASTNNESSYSSDDEEEEEDDDDDDGSLDFLATAREIDPESIRAREREYDANMAERLAEEIPAGSSAATAGGGSGHNSPNHNHNSSSPVVGKNGKTEKKDVPAATVAAHHDDEGSPPALNRDSLKRTRTSDGVEKNDEKPSEKAGRFE